MKVLINCCPRSGTHYVVKILKEYGLDFGHENDAKHGMTNWFYTPELPDDSIVVQKKNFKLITEPNGRQHVLKRPLHRNFQLPTREFKSAYKNIHQVRHPLHCIISMHKVFPRNIEWATSFFPPIETQDKPKSLRRYMRMWYHWNLIGEENSKWTYRVEGLVEDAVLNDFCKHFEITDKPKIEKIIAKTKTTVWRRKNLPTITWDHMRKADEDLTDEIITLATKYGYEI